MAPQPWRPSVRPFGFSPVNSPDLRRFGARRCFCLCVSVCLFLFAFEVFFLSPSASEQKINEKKTLRYYCCQSAHGGDYLTSGGAAGGRAVIWKIASYVSLRHGSTKETDGLSRCDGLEAAAGGGGAMAAGAAMAAAAMAAAAMTAMTAAPLDCVDPC